MNTLYPIFVKLRGKKCIVVGGGMVASRKVKKLLEARADVTVISPRVTEELEEHASRKDVHVIRRQYRNGDLENAFLVIGATDSKKINESIAKYAKKKKILFNIVDAPSMCDFFVPSIYTQGDLKIAVSTNGKSPAVARKIREELALLYGAAVASILRDLGSVRKKLASGATNFRKRTEILSRIVQTHTLFSLNGGRRGDLGKLREEIKRWS